MRAVFASDVAKIATDAFVVIDFGNSLVAKIESLPFLQRRHRFADKLHHTLESFGIQIIVQSFNHVLHDAKTVMHDRRADLDTRRTKRDELSSVPPIRYSANT